MKLKDFSLSEQETIQFLADVGLEVSDLNSEDLDANPTIKEQMDWCASRIRMLDDLYNIAVELDARETTSNCVVDSLVPLSWDEVCDKGIEILKKLKEPWKENNK